MYTPPTPDATLAGLASALVSAMPPAALQALALALAPYLAPVQVSEHEPSESEFMTAAEAAALLRCKPQRVYDLTYTGRITALGTKGARLYRRTEVLALAEGRVGGEVGAALQAARANRANGRAG